MTRTRAATRSSMDLDERAESFFDWIQTHGRQIGIIAAVIAAIALGGWLYAKSEAGKEQRAYESLGRASEAVSARNWALAQSDLEKVVARYPGTASGQQAALLLAEVLYATGKPQQGIDQLQKLDPDEEIESAVRAQIAAGYEQLGKFEDAARYYREAAQAARFDGERDVFLADAARSLQLGGKSDEARKIWSELADREQSPVAGEARVRLGELSAKPARK
jgi:predicted negative regulator of RcsB-dependent stress response